jgi:hypothetical protein
MFHPNIAECLGCYYTHAQILYVSEYLCFDQFICIFENQKLTERANKRMVKFIAAQILSGKLFEIFSS